MSWLPCARPLPIPPRPVLADADSADQRAIPPELGPDSFAVLSGPTFLYSNACGDVPVGSIGGLVHLDTRLISGWSLTVNGGELLVLRSETIDHYSAQYVLTNPELPGCRRTVWACGDCATSATVSRAPGMVSFRLEPVRVELRLAVAADFADLFEVKSRVRDRAAEISRHHAVDGSELCFSYQRGDFSAQTRVCCATPADRIDGDDLVWELDLGPARSGRSTCTYRCRPGWGGRAGPGRHRRRHPRPGRRPAAPVDRGPGGATQRQRGVGAHRAAVPQRPLRAAPRPGGQGSADHAARCRAAVVPHRLRPGHADHRLPDVGRRARFGEGALLALARLQGDTCDDFTDEEPGKILHEVRSGELTRSGEKPFGPYYGTADATNSG
ncbi:glycogen debranching N-terminal domain-containing protein [Micromonospora sp. M12]